ncbi:hypothetical protein ANO11243_092760 [Dothideomycetidae sp. 11243]|nr:hypothetical protein ANO11243_092760 [fungal sp. No.11243]
MRSLGQSPRSLALGALLAITILVILVRQRGFPDVPVSVSIGGPKPPSAVSKFGKAFDRHPGGSPNYTYSYCVTSSVNENALAHDWMPAEPATSYYWPEKPRPRGAKYTRGLAMARTSIEDVSWLDTEALDITPYIYVVDDPNAALTVPMNKGHEVMVYLTYIIDHYTSLPDISIFMHAHRYADHNDPILRRDAVEILGRLNNDRVIHEGYVNLNCATHEGCPTILQNANARQPWGDALLDFYTRLYPDRPAPFELSQPCCAQFAVSRNRIIGTSLAQYESFREWVLQSRLSDYHSGRVWEYLWHLIFTGLEVRCPEEYRCYCDTYGICFAGPEELKVYKALGARVHEIGKRLDEIGALVATGLMVDGSPDAKKFAIEESALKRKVNDYEAMQEEMRAVAIERGKDPKLRAEVGQRGWNEGD